MSPEFVAQFLRRVAARIDQSSRPSRRLVAADIFRVLLATDSSLSLKIREAVSAEVDRIMASSTVGGFDSHDTNEETGKGRAGGYVSWGMKPMAWNKKIVGGILISGKFTGFKSEEPDHVGDWTGRSDGGDSIIFDLNAGYYNKRSGGGVGTAIESLGFVQVYFDEMENVIKVDMEDENKVRDGLNRIVDSVLQNPPAGSTVTIPAKKRTFTDPNSLYQYAKSQNQIDASGALAVYGSQVKLLAKFMPGATGINLSKIMNYFNSRGIRVDPSL